MTNPTAVLGDAILGEMILGTVPQPVVTPITPCPYVPIKVYDSSMVLLAILDNYEYFTYTQNWYVPDEWQIYINNGKVGVDQITTGGFISLTLDGKTLVGMIRKMELALNPDDGTEQWTISGKGVESIFESRLAAISLDAGDGYDTFTGQVADAMRYYVNGNCIATADVRKITGLVLDEVTNTTGLAGTGPDIVYKARLQTIAEILEELSRMYSQSYRLEWSGSGLNFTFKILDGIDLSERVILSTEFGNVLSGAYLESIEDYRNLLYVGLAGEGELRPISTSYEGTTEPSGWDRHESFVDAPDLTTDAEVAARVLEELNTLQEMVSLDVEYFEGGTFRAGIDFDLGDTVTIVYPGVAVLTSRIIGMTTEIDPDFGKKVTLSIGKEYPDVKQVRKVQDRKIRDESRK